MSVAHLPQGIEKIDEPLNYILSSPNKEVRDSVFKHLLADFLKLGVKGSDMKRLLSKAFAQIREKQYDIPYLNSGKAIYHIAVVFVGKKVAGKAERGV